MKELIGDHWQERTSYYSEYGSSEYVEYPELVLRSNNAGDARVLSISIEEGNVFFNEKCDDNFSVEMTPADAIEALGQAIAWVKEETNGRADALEVDKR